MQIKNKNFFFGGNATFTAHNASGEHYTFKIKGGSTKPFFVSLLKGPNNQSDYVYIGILDQKSQKLRLTSKSKVNQDSKIVKIFNWAISAVSNSKIPSGYGVLHENTCCRCGRALTTPESILNGIGPECMKKHVNW